MATVRGHRRGRNAALVLVTAAGLFGGAAVVPPAYAGIGCGTPLAVGDCTPPNTVLTGEPPSSTDADDATFTFTVDPQEAGDTFACKLDGPAPAAHDWTDCTDPAPPAGSSTGRRSYSGLTVGTYTFSVRASDHPNAGDPNVDGSPATYTWHVVDSPPPPDTSAPDTRIKAAPPRWLLFPFTRVRYAGDPDTTGFRCLLNGAAVRNCSYGQADIFGMKGRDYHFTVAAQDRAGNVDPTPAGTRWTVPVNNTFLHEYSRGWKEKSGRGYFEDSYSITQRRGAFVRQGQRKFRSVALVVTKCPDCGTVVVTLGSRVLRRIDLHAAKRKQRRLVRIASWHRPHSGTLEIRVTSSGKDVIIEGLGFSRRR